MHRRFGWFGNVPREESAATANAAVAGGGEDSGGATKRQLAEVDIERSLMRTGLGEQSRAAQARLQPYVVGRLAAAGGGGGWLCSISDRWLQIRRSQFRQHQYLSGIGIPSVCTAPSPSGMVRGTRLKVSSTVRGHEIKS